MPNNIKIELALAGRKVEMSMAVDGDCATDRELLHALRVCGCPEPEVSHLMARAIQPGDFVMDGGANIGFFTVLMSKFVGEKGYVFSFEPGENNLFKLRENVKLNKCMNVEIVPYPLWNKKETVELHMCEDGSKNSLAAHDGTRGASLMETTTLNDYATDDIKKRLRLIKLDIEGAEEMTLRGGKQLLNDGYHCCPYLVMELNVEALPKFGSSVKTICDFLREYGYSPFLLHPNGALPTLIPRHTKVNPGRLNWNVLFSTVEYVEKAWPEINV